VVGDLDVEANAGVDVVDTEANVDMDMEVDADKDDVVGNALLLAVTLVTSVSSCPREVICCEFELACFLLYPPLLLVDVDVSSSDNDKSIISARSHILISLFSSID